MSNLLGEPIGLVISDVAGLTDRQIHELYRRVAARINGKPLVDRDAIPEPETPEEQEQALRSLMEFMGASPAKIEAEVRRQIRGE